jgi:hypothetical protein
VYLICIEEELEAWLLADHRAIAAFLSVAVHQVKSVKHPERVRNPKRQLQKIFQQHGRSYNDIVDAERLVKKLPDLNRVEKRCKTFTRFAKIVTGQKS